ncbi:killer cell lectin-like receptor subfamily B member 1 [Erinaceus europaeus]|uniref:Killer cell lectin-like receptor subfamily B member 1 n=1 Tax=Erinaceus europaeus TaxID=9365 RepID=A0A1S2Z9B3_ERIEU|nr:killer cell lectin-like receptor subfamily B member 1 [Erinaceus europaeus]
MDQQVVYADLDVCRGTGRRVPSHSPLHQDICQGPPWHRFALKLGCSILLFLAFAVIGLSVSVIFLQQTLPVSVNTVHAQENLSETTERPFASKCTEPWYPIREKCLLFTSDVCTWNQSLTNCKGSSLLLIQDQEELRLIQKRIDSVGVQFWIGLKYSPAEKNWKWINGSFLNSEMLQVTGISGKNICVSISNTKLTSEHCEAESRSICQKELKPIRKKVYSDS